MLRKLLPLLFFLFCIPIIGQETIKAMFYNLLEFPSASPGSRDIILRTILDEYQPDIFMICELESEQGADLILNNSLNNTSNNYSRADYVSNTSSSSNLQQLIYFRNDKFTLETSEIIQTNVRDINRYLLKLNTANAGGDPVLINIYVTHLKASTGSSNENTRLDMVNEFIATLNGLDPNSFLIFSGDLNVYDSEEPAYQKLLDPNNVINLVDPINRPGDWNNNIEFQDIHTQSTRISSGPFGAGAGGGLDDRFDFMLVSENMLTNPKLRYVEGTYKSYGNNGNCYNNEISSASCSGEYSQQIRNRLFSMSDHLPVVMELETNQEILSVPKNEATNFVEIENTLAKNELRLLISPEIKEEVEFNIYNTMGQLLMVIPRNAPEKFAIDISALSEGIYYLETNLPKSKTLKFLKTY